MTLRRRIQQLEVQDESKQQSLDILRQKYDNAAGDMSSLRISLKHA